MRVLAEKNFVTCEDKNLLRVEALKAHMRSHPLLPPDPRDPSQAYSELHKGVLLPLLHCAFQGCTWTADVGAPYLPRHMGHWDLEFCVFVHLMEDHADLFAETIRNFKANADSNAMNLSVLPGPCTKRSKRTDESWQDDLFLRVYSDYMLAVCEKEREDMPLVGLAKDRQVLRPLNRILSSAQSHICFCCAQMHSRVGLWSHMYTPRKMGLHKVPDQDFVWSEHTSSTLSLNSIEKYTVRESLQRFYRRNESSFRLHFDLEQFKDRYCAESQPGGNPFRNSTSLEGDSYEWVQNLHLDNVAEVVALLISCDRKLLFQVRT